MPSDLYDQTKNQHDFKQMLTGLRDRTFGDYAQMYIGNNIAILPKLHNYKTVFITPFGVACRLAELASITHPEKIVSRINTDSQSLYFQSKNPPYYSCFDECRTIFYSRNGNLGKDYWAPFQRIMLLNDVFGLDDKFWMQIEEYRLKAHGTLTISGAVDSCYKCFDDTIYLLKQYMPLDPLRPLSQVFWDQI